MTGTGLAIAGSELVWKRIYEPGTRNVIHSDAYIEGGVYRMREARRFVYIVSFAPRVNGELGEFNDLGQYRRRAQCDARVLAHIRTGR